MPLPMGLHNRFLTEHHEIGKAVAGFIGVQRGSFREGDRDAIGVFFSLYKGTIGQASNRYQAGRPPLCNLYHVPQPSVGGNYYIKVSIPQGLL